MTAPGQPAEAGVTAPADLSRAHLRLWLEVLEGRVGELVRLRRARRSRPPDGRLRGIYLSDDDVDALLTAPPEPSPLGGGALGERAEAVVDEAEATGATSRLRLLEERFGLSPLERTVLLCGLAPDVDVRFERLYGYLHDDLSLRRATVGLAFDLAGRDPLDPEARAAVSPAGRLAERGLLVVDEPGRPYLTRSLRVPDRVTAFLAGHDELDPVLEPYLVTSVAWAAGGHEHVVGALRTGTRLFYAQASHGTGGSSLFAAALRRLGIGTLELDFDAPAGTVAGLVPAVVRECGLADAGLIVGHADELARKDPGALRRITETPGIVCLTGTRPWDPDWARLLPLLVEVPNPLAAERAGMWAAILGTEPRPGTEGWAEALSALRVEPLQMLRATDSARRAAAGAGRDVTLADVHTAALAINSAALDGLSLRVRPRARWDDLVLAPPVERTVHKLVSRERHREVVQGDWGFGRANRRHGTIALFSGPPGTGKTLAAEVVAGELGVDLYVVNLATVVDKYIGETEKNLERVFHAAERTNGLLFFDEADALFGKRSEVKDARDRYANVEVAYLLQRLERFEGVVVLATNLTANIDEAFGRRLDIAVDFRLPDLVQRRQLWRMSLPEPAPLAADVDLEFLAGAFELSGGSIRNICVEAAYLARECGSAVAMAHLVRATALEHRKLGRLLSAAEFKEYLDLAKQELAS